MRMIMPICMAMVVFARSSDSAVSDKVSPLRTVPHVDLNRYLGKWYEIASFPQWFQEGCVASTATYTSREDGDINVLNECRKGSLDGDVKRAKGKAWIVDRQTNARLKVRFFWPFSGDYWIIDLSDDYQFAVVGHPNRNYLWILSRTPRMDPSVYDGILERLKKQQYDVSRLRRTLQPGQ